MDVIYRKNFDEPPDIYKTPVLRHLNRKMTNRNQVDCFCVILFLSLGALVTSQFDGGHMRLVPSSITHHYISLSPSHTLTWLFPGCWIEIIIENSSYFTYLGHSAAVSHLVRHNNLRWYWSIVDQRCHFISFISNRAKWKWIYFYFTFFSNFLSLDLHQRFNWIHSRSIWHSWWIIILGFGLHRSVRNSLTSRPIGFAGFFVQRDVVKHAETASWLIALANCVLRKDQSVSMGNVPETECLQCVRVLSYIARCEVRLNCVTLLALCAFSNSFQWFAFQICRRYSIRLIWWAPTAAYYWPT